ncbi:DMSO/selenate family reductase complex B subunit [uncultured Adlercreutzia sp.]|uniref:DMSO/selenate family reductase complex B subunit n=1 Tax=uncultured Adlercreutzia sp. TaxID=875803 RepID=UPI0025CFDF56|nr:DMSO/selenate family reductase complex B subunit [uncultured Adlercreutzia sp.]
MQYGFHFDGARCTGCKTCMLACKDYHGLPSSLAFRQVYEYGGGSWTRHDDGTVSHDTFAYHLSGACNHCANPVCVRVCPTGAMHKDDRGLVSVNAARCIGCGYCALSCPYRAPKVDREAGHSVKCDGCAGRLDEGREPVCVEACPLRVLSFGPIDELREQFGKAADLAPLPPSDVTAPSLALTLPAFAREHPDRVAAEGHVLNGNEIV